MRWQGGGEREADREDNEKEGERRGEEGARVCQTETEASVYICNESFIDVVVVSVAG